MRDSRIIQVPRELIFGLMFALVPGFAAVVNMIGDPRLHGIRSLDVVRLMAMGWCAGIFFSGLLLLFSSKITSRTLAASDLDRATRQSSSG